MPVRDGRVYREAGSPKNFQVPAFSSPTPLGCQNLPPPPPPPTPPPPLLLPPPQPRPPPQALPPPHPSAAPPLLLPLGSTPPTTLPLRRPAAPDPSRAPPLNLALAATVFLSSAPTGLRRRRRPPPRRHRTDPAIFPDPLAYHLLSKPSTTLTPASSPTEDATDHLLPEL